MTMFWKTCCVIAVNPPMLYFFLSSLNDGGYSFLANKIIFYPFFNGMMMLMCSFIYALANQHSLYYKSEVKYTMIPRYNDVLITLDFHTSESV